MEKPSWVYEMLREIAGVHHAVVMVGILLGGLMVTFGVWTWVFLINILKRLPPTP